MTRSDEGKNKACRGKVRSDMVSGNKDTIPDDRAEFEEAISIIERARVNAFTAVNRELIAMY